MAPAAPSRASPLRRVAADAAGTVRSQWRSAVLPALVLWFLSAYVSVTLLHPYDVTEFAKYAHGALASPLLHRFPQEYPAPALAVFVAPLLLGISYPWAFAMVVAVALVALVTHYEGSGLPGWDTKAAGRLIIYLAIGSVMVLAGRYDLFAVLACFLSVRAARQGRWSAAWTWSAVGCALKLFPAALWPVFAVAEWRLQRRLPVRRLWWVAGALMVTIGAPALLDRGAVFNVVHYYLHRPTEMGSMAAGLSVLVDPSGSTWTESFRSTNVVSGITTPLSAGIELLGVGACVWTWWQQLRGRLSLEAACLATLTFVVLGGKVVSVQYLMWLMPFWALYRLRLSWLLASAANVVVFPYSVTATQFGYIPTHPFSVSLTLAFFARDVLVAAGTVAWLRHVYERGPVSGDPARHAALSRARGAPVRG